MVCLKKSTPYKQTIACCSLSFFFSGGKYAFGLPCCKLNRTEIIGPRRRYFGGLLILGNVRYFAEKKKGTKLAIKSTRVRGRKIIFKNRADEYCFL